MQLCSEPIGEAVVESGGRIVGAASYDPFRITDSIAEVERAVKEQRIHVSSEFYGASQGERPPVHDATPEGPRGRHGLTRVEMPEVSVQVVADGTHRVALSAGGGSVPPGRPSVPRRRGRAYR